jgi:hypothetical protein
VTETAVVDGAFVAITPDAAAVQREPEASRLSPEWIPGLQLGDRWTSPSTVAQAPEFGQTPSADVQPPEVNVQPPATSRPDDVFVADGGARRPSNGQLVPEGPTSFALARRDIGYPLSEPLSDVLAEAQRELVPAEYQNHPEFGMRSVDDSAGSIELIHMRTANSRYLYNVGEGTIEGITAQAPIHYERDGWLFPAMGDFNTVGAETSIDTAWFHAQLDRSVSEGAVVFDDSFGPTGLAILDNAVLNAVSADKVEALALPAGEWVQTDLNRIQNEQDGMKFFWQTARRTIGYGFQVDEAWVGRLGEGTERVELSQSVMLDPEWAVLFVDSPEAGPQELGSEWVETCGAVFIGANTDDSVTISPPSLFDAADPEGEYAEMLHGIGCGDRVFNRVRRVDDELQIVASLDAEWMRSDERSFPLTFDPFWTFTRRVIDASSPGYSWWTPVGWLDDRANTNNPSSNTYYNGYFYFQNGFYYDYFSNYSGMMGAAGQLRGRSHFTVEGIDASASSIPGGQNAEYFPITVERTYITGPFGRTSTGYGRPSTCSSSDPSYNTYSWHWGFAVTYQDERCVTGTGSNYSFATQWTNALSAPALRRISSTNFTSPLPVAGWASPIRCNNCASGTFAEGSVCPAGDAGGSMASACRAFQPASGATINFTGNISSNDTDHFGLYFPGTRAPQMTFTVTDGSGGCAFDSVIELWRVQQGEGPQLFASKDDDFDAATGTTNQCPSFTTYGHLPPGAYSIAIRGFTQNDTGNYRITVSVDDDPAGYVGIFGMRYYGFQGGIDATYDYLGPNNSSNLYWSETVLPDLGGLETTTSNCESWNIQYIGNPWGGWSVNPFITITYVGRVTQSPNNLGGRPLSAAECAAAGRPEGCGLEWTWSAAPKARWYNLLDGSGRIDNITSLNQDETGLMENTRYSRRIEGANEYAPGPASASASATTYVRTPSTSDFSISNPSFGTARVSATAPPNLPGGAYSCTAGGNCTAIRYQARRCDPFQPACTTNLQCGTVAGQAGVCQSGICVADSGWTRATTRDFGTDGLVCYEFRTRYQNQDGVQSENWSSWVRQNFISLNPPVMSTPTCADMGDGELTFRLSDQSVGEDGFRLFDNAADLTAFATIASTTSGTVGTTYSRLISVAGAAGNVARTAVARSYSSPAGVPYESTASNQVTAYTRHRAPYSAEFRVDAVRSRAVDITVVSAENQPCVGRTGARVQRCNAAGNSCVTVSDFSLPSPYAGCPGRGYGTQWEFNGGTIPGVGDGQLFDSGLQPSTTYEYRMWYYNAAGCISTNYVSRLVTTLPEGPCCYDPAAPTNINSTNCAGVCAGGTIACNGNTAATCYCQAPGTYSGVEACDALDNNCDGTVDDFTRLTSNQQGACSGNRDRCTNGAWSPIPTNHSPAPEACNGIDDDCDARTDEDAANAPLSEVCYSGPPGTAGVGLCRAGTRVCASARWGACTGQVTPTGEVCNLLDDDCDGPVDEDLANPYCLGGADDCSGPSPVGPSEPRACLDGCRIGDAICDNGVLYCDVSGRGGEVLDGDTAITSVEQGQSVDTSTCDNAYSDFVCGATTKTSFEIANNGQVPIAANTLVEFYLDYDTAAEERVAGPFALGTAIPVDGIQNFSFCWLNDVVARASQGRSLQVVISHPADPDTCIVSDRFSERVPAVLKGIEPEICDGIDNDCNGINDVRQSADACTNTAGDSTLTCRNTQFEGWICIAE